MVYTQGGMLGIHHPEVYREACWVYTTLRYIQGGMLRRELSHLWEKGRHAAQRAITPLGEKGRHAAQRASSSPKE